MIAQTSMAAGAAAICGLAAALGFAGWWRPDSRPLARTTDVTAVAALVAVTAVWALRWREAGHMPLFGTYESALSLAVAVLLAIGAARARGAAGAGLWPFGCAVAAALLAHGVRYDPTPYALTISERSWVVDVHAVVAWAAFGALAINAGLGLARLVRRPVGTDRALSYTLSLGFALHSAMMASGSLYKFLLFGVAWSFDPIETLGFVAWIAYGTLLHMHLMAGWSGRKLGAWCLALFAVLVVSYRGIVYFPAWSTYHIFDMDLRIHLTGSEELGFPEE